MRKFVFINRKLVEEKNATISINQRACLFGDGIFETCKIRSGIIYNFTAHQARIKAGLSTLKFKAKIDDLEKKSYQLIKKNQIKNGILRISISRGIGSLGYLPTYESSPLIIIQTLPERKILAKKIILGIGEIKKPPENSFPVFYKTMQALPYTLNKIAAQEAGVFDLIMLSQENFISETSSANIFWIKNGQIFAPHEDCDILLGTIREKIISNFNVKKVKEKISILENVDEIFLTNASMLVLAVDEIILPNKKIKLKKEVGLEVLEWLKKDIINNC